MALIKCTGCGHDVSDKASACPHCGCPILQEKNSVCEECGLQLPKNAIVCPYCGCPIVNIEAVQEVVYEEEPSKKKWWIWALAAALLCLIGGGTYYYLSEKDVPVVEISTEEKIDSVEVEVNEVVKEDIVELNPEFINAIKKYDIFEEFSDGYAAVLKGHQWRYINTKGEEVISVAINSEYVGRFSEGLAIVVAHDFEHFHVIDKKGDTVFKGKGYLPSWDILYIPIGVR